MNSFKKSLFEQFAVIAKAISSANRLEILEFLAQCEYSVEDLAKVMGLTIANTSHHLQPLRHAGLVETRKEGTRVYYRIKGSEVIALLDALRQVAEHNLAEVGHLVSTYLTSKDAMEPVSREALLERARLGLVTVLDVRPSHEYAAGHLPGAINIPFATLEQHLSELDPQQEIVAYCRGPHCILAFEAVNMLRAKGFQIRRLQEGYPQWQVAGLPIEGGSIQATYN